MGIFDFLKKKTAMAAVEMPNIATQQPVATAQPAPNNRPQNPQEWWFIDCCSVWLKFAGGRPEFLDGNFSPSSLKSSLIGGWAYDYHSYSDHNKAKEVFINEYFYPLINSQMVKDGIAKKYIAWDLYLASQMICSGYGGEIITRDEYIYEMRKVAKLIQKNFSSWEEYIELHFISMEEMLNNSETVMKRRAIYQQLKSPDSPNFKTPWETPLD